MSSENTPYRQATAKSHLALQRSRVECCEKRLWYAAFFHLVANAKLLRTTNGKREDPAARAAQLTGCAADWRFAP